MVTEFEKQAYGLRSAELTESVRVRHHSTDAWYLSFLRPWLPTDQSARILDLPCGDGNLLSALSAAGYRQVEGCDQSEGLVEIARQLGLPANVGDAIEVLDQQPRASVSRVFSLDFVEHLRLEDALRFCQSAFRALEPGGLLICRAPNGEGPFSGHDRYNDLTHQRAFTSASASQLLSMAGFGSDIELRGEPPELYKWPNYPRRALYEVVTRCSHLVLELAGLGPPKIWTRSMWFAGRKPGQG